MLVMSLADRVCFRNGGGGRAAFAHRLSTGLVGKGRRVKRRHVFLIVSRLLR